MTRHAIYPDLEDRAVVVTGGASGIGAAIVAAFAQQKARVGFLDIAVERGEAETRRLVGAGARVHFEPVDLTDIEAMRAGIDAVRNVFGPITVLINNAANDERHRSEDMTPAIWDERLAVNLRHQFFAAQAVIPDMIAQGGGAIVNFGSVSWMAGEGGMVAYTTAKSAVIGLTRSLARDYGAHEIRVNAIAPGWILTERQKARWVTPEAERKLMEEQCLKRWLTPEEIARFTLFLASSEASAATGQHYVVDGGWVY